MFYHVDIWYNTVSIVSLPYRRYLFHILPYKGLLQLANNGATWNCKTNVRCINLDLLRKREAQHPRRSGPSFVCLLYS